MSETSGERGSHGLFRANELRMLGLCVGLLNLAAVIVLVGQLKIKLMERPYLQSQLNYAAQRLTSVKNTQTETEQAIEKRNQQIKRSGALEGQYAALLTELLELAKTDPDARAITQKWKIQQQGAPRVDELPAGGAPSDSKVLPVKQKPGALRN